MYPKLSNMIIPRTKYKPNLPLYSREQLCSVLLNLEQFPSSVVTELVYGAGDVLLTVDVCLVRALPRLDVHQGYPGVQRAEILWKKRTI